LTPCLLRKRRRERTRKEQKGRKPHHCPT